MALSQELTFDSGAENREGVSILLGVSMLSVIDLEGEGMVGA